MQVIGIKTKKTKYYCCDCGKKLSARAKTPEWRRVPANQKRCQSCSARFRGLMRNMNSRLEIKRNQYPINAPAIPKTVNWIIG